MSYLLFVFYFLWPTQIGIGQGSGVPLGIVNDPATTIANTAIVAAKVVMEKALEKERGFISIIEDVNLFFQKAKKKVNNAITNMRLIRAIVENYEQIIDMYSNTIDALNGNIFTTVDGVDIHEAEVFNKLKHIKTLSRMLRLTESVFEIFTKLIEEDSLVMDDKGRVILLQKTYAELQQLKLAMRAEIWSINKEILTYKKELDELNAHKAFFDDFIN